MTHSYVGWLRNINVESTIETQGGSERRDDLSQQSVQVGVSGTFNVQVTTADIVPEQGKMRFARLDTYYTFLYVQTPLPLIHRCADSATSLPTTNAKC